MMAIDLTELKKASKQISDLNKQLSTNIKRLEAAQEMLQDPKKAIIQEGVKRLRGKVPIPIPEQQQ